MNTEIKTPNPMDCWPATDDEIAAARVFHTDPFVRGLIARIEQQQLRAQDMAELLTKVRPSCVRSGYASLVEAIDAAIAGIPTKPQPVPDLSPTVVLMAHTKAIFALIRGNGGEAFQHMRQLGDIGQEVR